MNDHLDPKAVKAIFDKFPTLIPVRGDVGDRYKESDMDSTACLIGAVGQFVNRSRATNGETAPHFDPWDAINSILPDVSSDYSNGLWRGWDSGASPAEIRRRMEEKSLYMKKTGSDCDEGYLGWLHGAIAARATIEKDVVLEDPS